MRAGAARAGLWGNHGYEAAYSWAYVDDRGEQLTGGRRYAIHFDPTPGLVMNADGSLDIAIQAESPGPDGEANWLPAPAGDFRPLIRMYQPGEEVLSGAYALPPIRRVE